ncbi:MAG: thrombospondin type 3 repeat-containing protein [bacterium]
MATRTPSPTLRTTAPDVANQNQANNDGDAQGGLCDSDDDNDNVIDVLDNCPLVANENQLNTQRRPGRCLRPG